MRRLLLVGLCVLLVLGGAAYAWVTSDQVRQVLERQATAALGMPVRIDSARASFSPRVGLELRGVRVGDPAFLVLARVSVTSELWPLMSRRIEGASIVVADTTLNLPLPTALRFPGVGGEGAKRAWAISSVHTIGLERVKVRSLGRTIEVSASAGWTPDRLSVTRFSATAGRTALSAQGLVVLGTKPAVTLEATASELDLDDLLALTHAFGFDGESSSGGGGTWPEGSLVFRLSSPTVRVAGLAGTALSVLVRTDGGELKVDPFELHVFGGTVKGSLRLKIRNEVSGRIAVSVVRMEAGQLAAWSGSPDTLTGRLSGSGVFAGEGQDLAALLRAATGSGAVEIVDGALRGLEFPREALLALGRPVDQAPPPNGGRFERLAMSFGVAGGRLAGERIELRSRDVSVDGSGWLDLGTTQMEVMGTVALSEALTVLAGPVMSRFASDGARIVLPTSVKGPLASPKVRVDAAALLRRAAKGEAKRLLLDRLTPMRELAVPKLRRTF